MRWAAVVGFLAAILPLVMTPGASLTLMTQRTLAGQRNSASWVIAGTATGIYVHALFAAAGLSAIALRSSEAFTVIKIGGGVYLIGLGLLTIWQTRRRLATAARRLPRAGHHTYPQAVLANVLNPKAASIYLTLAPQFLTVGQVSVGPLLILASVHVLAMAAWLGLWSIIVNRGNQATHSEAFKRAVKRLGGTILVALGVRTVTA